MNDYCNKTYVKLLGGNVNIYKVADKSLVQLEI